LRTKHWELSLFEEAGVNLPESVKGFVEANGLNTEVLNTPMMVERLRKQSEYYHKIWYDEQFQRNALINERLALKLLRTLNLASGFEVKTNISHTLLTQVPDCTGALYPQSSERVTELFNKACSDLGVDYNNLQLVVFKSDNYDAMQIAYLGQEKQVVCISSRLLNEFDDDEISSVIRHEIGEYKHSVENPDGNRLAEIARLNYNPNPSIDIEDYADNAAGNTPEGANAFIRALLKSREGSKEIKSTFKQVDLVIRLAHKESIWYKNDVQTAYDRVIEEDQLSGKHPPPSGYRPLDERIERLRELSSQRSGHDLL